MAHVTVIATFVAKRGKEAAAAAALQTLVAPTRAEHGCVNYDLHRAPDDPRKFLFHENWLSTADLQRHLQTAHIAAVRAKVAELFDEGPTISLWEQV